MRSESSRAHESTRDDIAEDVVRIIAEVTRYPRNILTPEALLEDELGIESVKRAEILTVLSNRMSFEIPKENTFGNIKSVADVIAAVERLTPSGGAPAPVARQRAEVPPPPVEYEPVRERKIPPVLPVVPERRDRDALPLAGKLAFVAGSGHGIGRDIAQHLHRLGASIILNSFHSREEGERAAAELQESGNGPEVKGRTVTHLWGSVANNEHLVDIFQQMEGRHGYLDFLVSSASNAPIVPVSQIQPEDWERAFRTEVVGLHQMALAAARLMQARGGGRIVAVTHPAAHRVFPGSACGGTVKAAVESLVRYLAIDLSAKGILVNTLCAGPFARDIEAHPDRDAILQLWRQRAPGGRLPDSRSVAAAVALLLSPDAGMMTGSTMVVDGGLSLGL